MHLLPGAQKVNEAFSVIPGSDRVTEVFSLFPRIHRVIEVFTMFLGAHRVIEDGVVISDPGIKRLQGRGQDATSCRAETGSVQAPSNEVARTTDPNP